MLHWFGMSGKGFPNEITLGLKLSDFYVIIIFVMIIIDY